MKQDLGQPSCTCDGFECFSRNGGRIVRRTTGKLEFVMSRQVTECPILVAQKEREKAVGEEVERS